MASVCASDGNVAASEPEAHSANLLPEAASEPEAHSANLLPEAPRRHKVLVGVALAAASQLGWVCIQSSRERCKRKSTRSRCSRLC